ncbi:MAG: ribosome small subunit-dependent GTPase A [Gammaproteobacteria bacterium]|nr:ribosome small subunit-dependent GTPase A [Gammaproteobacteria bacterium]
MEFDAQVIAAYGRHLKVRNDDGQVLQARPFGRKLQPVCGDRVRCAADAAHDEIHITAILPRRSLLARATLRGDAEPVVANLSLLVAVMAPLPHPDLFIIDRYLCAASSAGLKAVVLVNKADLLSDPAATHGGTRDAAVAALTHGFESAGYPVVGCSAESGAGLEALRQQLRGETSVFVGQSGVGKSSLIARLVPALTIATGELDRDAEGRHTTTSSALYDLPEGGAVIDSPGVRDFAPAIAGLEARSLGFPEVDQLAVGCRFIDCQHLQEPGCAVRAAVDSGAFDARRYESYRRLRRLHRDLKAAQGPRRRRDQDRD